MIHDEVSAALKRWVIDEGAAPGGSACVGVFGPAGWQVAQGVAGVLAPDAERLVDARTLYDLASLTKPLVASALARMIRGGRLEWQQPIGEVLPEVGGTAGADCPLDLLASHRSGFEAHLVLGDPAGRQPWDREAALRRCAAALREDCRGRRPAEGFPPVYSDLGYVLLGAAMQRAAGQSLADVVRDHVVAPLALGAGAASELSTRHPDFFERVAPTETLPARGGRLRGVVHDDNAWLLGGSGLSGHAGAFGTANDVARFGMAMIDALAGRRPDWLRPSEVNALIRARPGGSLLTGFDGKSGEGSSAGPRFGPRAFGHLGYTGTSIWCDPDAGIVVSVLTNRVCPSRENVRIRSVRPALHGQLFDLGVRMRS